LAVKQVLGPASTTNPAFGINAAGGLTEEEAVARHREVDVYSCKFRPMKSALGGADGQCLFKLIVSRADDRILGAHLIGPEAAEMIQLLSAALNMGARGRRGAGDRYAL
jgi:glutathione reductase (NADPH)